MTAPDPRLGEIEARLSAATPGPWTADTGTRGDCVVWGPNGRFLMNMQAEPYWLEYPGETRSVAFDVDKRDAEFIAGARADVAYLLAELRKAQDALGRVEGLCGSWQAMATTTNTADTTLRATVYAIRAAVAAATGGGDQ